MILDKVFREVLTKDADAYWYLTRPKQTYVYKGKHTPGRSPVVLVGYIRCCDRDTRRSKQGLELVVCQGVYTSNLLEPLLTRQNGTAGKDSMVYTVHRILFYLPPVWPYGDAQPGSVPSSQGQA